MAADITPPSPSQLPASGASSRSLTATLASLLRLAPFAPSPSPAPGTPPSPLELLWADLLPVKLAHTGVLRIADVAAACELAPLPRGGDSAVAREETWTPKAVQGVVAVLEGLEMGEDGEARARVFDWAEGLVAVLERRVASEGKGKGKGKAIVDHSFDARLLPHCRPSAPAQGSLNVGALQTNRPHSSALVRSDGPLRSSVPLLPSPKSASPPLSAHETRSSLDRETSMSTFRAPETRVAKETHPTDALDAASSWMAGPRMAHDTCEPVDDDEYRTENDEADGDLPVRNQLARAQAERGRAGEDAEGAARRGAARSLSTVGQQKLVLDSEYRSAAVSAAPRGDAEMTEAAQLGGKGKARARSRPVSAPGATDVAHRPFDGAPGRAPGFGQWHAPHSAAARLEKVDGGAVAPLTTDDAALQKRKKPVAPRASLEGGGGKARAGIFSRGEEGANELASSEENGGAAAPSPAKKPKKGLEKKRKKPARPPPSLVSEEEDELVSSTDDNAPPARDKGKGKAAPRARKKAKKAPVAPPEGQKPVAPAPNKRLKPTESSAAPSTSSDRNGPVAPRKGKGKAAARPAKRLGAGETTAKQRTPGADAASAASVSTDDEAGTSVTLAVPAKLRARRSASASTGRSAASVPVKRQLPPRMAAPASASALSSSSAPSPAKKPKRGAVIVQREPQSKPRISARIVRGYTQGGGAAEKEFEAGDIWYRNESMGGKVWPVLILDTGKDEVAFAVVPANEAAALHPVLYTLRPTAARTTLASEAESVLLAPAQQRALDFAQALLADKRRKKAWLERVVLAQQEEEDARASDED